MKFDSVRKDLATSRVRVPMKTKELLRRYADKYERSFPTPDPSDFMSKASGSRNKEATAFVAACLSFGAIEQFNPKIKQLIDLAGKDMDKWIRSRAFLHTIPDEDNRKFYRFVTYANLRVFLCAYRRLMRIHGTLGKYVRATGDGTGFGAVNAICKAFADSGAGYLVPSKTLSACKRLCLFLRWMVRKSSVDIGLWSGFINRKTLIMPLDTHVIAQAQKFGLLARETASMATARKLTKIMAKVFPEDPLRGDFALFGLGRSVNGN